MSERLEVFPFRPGDWVWDGRRPAKVKSVWEGEPGEVLLDLVIYDQRGERVGRESPACGGPRTYEPACSATNWTRITQPRWPIEYKWVESGPGRVTAQPVAGTPLPPANWKKPARRLRMSSLAAFREDRLRAALEKIADGHNDPRTLAEEVLGRRQISK